MPTLQERVAAQEEKLNGHEETCAVRYGAINENLAALWKRSGRIEMAAWSLLVAVVGWLALHVLDEHQNAAAAPAPAPAIHVLHRR